MSSAEDHGRMAWGSASGAFGWRGVLRSALRRVEELVPRHGGAFGAFGARRTVGRLEGWNRLDQRGFHQGEIDQTYRKRGILR